MDSFSRFTHPALKLDDYFDEIVNSFNEGTHKTDNKGALFLKYANKYGTAIENCLLFDDSLNVQKTFRELGGTPYLVTKDKPLAIT
jgi:FMN phosphatase YigB (HAD superfamily)